MGYIIENMFAEIEKTKSGVTHAQIAEAVGVSRAIVTHALHGSRQGRMSEAKREEILAMARRMGYRPRNVATYNIAFISSTGGLQNQEDFALFVHVEREVRKHGYRLMLINSDDVLSPGPLQKEISLKTVDGILMTEWREGNLESLASEVPRVLLSEEPVDPDVEQVGVDLKGTAVNILEFLHGQGHDRVCLVSGVAEDNFHQRLQEAFYAAADEVGCPREGLCVLAADPTVITQPLLELMRGPRPPSALISADTYRTFPVYCSLLENGYRIPRDISFVAFFDAMSYATVGSGITATTALGGELAARAVERLIERIENPYSEPRRTLVPGELVERASVASLWDSANQTIKRLSLRAPIELA